MVTEHKHHIHCKLWKGTVPVTASDQELLDRCTSTADTRRATSTVNMTPQLQQRVAESTESRTLTTFSNPDYNEFMPSMMQRWTRFCAPTIPKKHLPEKQPGNATYQASHLSRFPSTTVASQRRKGRVDLNHAIGMTAPLYQLASSDQLPSN